MKKLMFASAAAALASAAFATVGTSTGFEEYAAANVTHIAGYDDTGANNAAVQNNIYWTGSQGGTAVSNFVNTPAAPAGGFPGSGLSWGDNYLDLNTENDILWRSVNASADGSSLGSAQAIESALYIDTMVQFTVTEAGNEPTDLDATDKLAIWLGTVTNAEGEVTSTNLFVRALMVGDNDEVTSVATNFKLTKQGVVPGTWYRLTVKAIKDATWRGRVTSKAEEGQPDGAIVAYEIYLDQEKLYTDVDTFAEEYVDLASGFSDGWLDEDEDDEQAVIEAMQSKSLFPSLVGPSTLATLQGVGFKGSGAIDDLVVGDKVPNFLAGTLEGSGTAEDPWQLGSADDIATWMDGLGSTYQASQCYKLTANIDLTDSDVSLPLFPNWGTVEFAGTFDGDNHTVTYALTDTDEDHGRFGLFGKARNATFKNLVVDGTYGEGTVSSAAIVLGQGYDDITFVNVTAKGSDIYAQSNLAGLLCNWTAVTNEEIKVAHSKLTFTACTNEATLTTGYTKAGGMVSYDGNVPNLGVVLTDCLNKGAITCNATYVNDKGAHASGAWVGGMIGWAGYYGSIAMTNCHNTGTLSAKQWTCGSGNATVRAGGLVGNCGNAITLTGCSNAGSVTGLAEEAGTSGQAAGGIGGLLGFASSTVTLDGCSNAGTVAFGGTPDISAFTKRAAFIGYNNGQVTLDGENVCAYGGLAPFGIPTATKFTGYAVAWKNHASTTLTWMNLADLLEVEAIGGYVCFTVDGQEFSKAEEASNGKLGVGTCFNIDGAGYDKTKALAYVDTGLIINADGYVAKLSFTLNVPESGVEDMEFQENDGGWEAIVASETIDVLVGDVIEIRGTVNGHTKTISVTASEETAAITLPPAGMCYYLVDQDANDGSADKPYTLGTVADLNNFRDALNDGFGRTLNYKVTADIALTEAWTPVDDFNGTFDGGNYTISNLFFKRAKGNYQGLFAQVTSATNRNLKLVLAGWTGAPKGTTGDDAEFGGAALAGKANTFALFENIVVSGSTTGATHNVAGIVCRTYGGDFTFNNCTNRAEVSGCYSKVGGLVNMVGVSGTTTFNDCSNEGHVYVAPTNGVYSGGNNGGVGGFVAYTADAAKVVLSGCSSTGTLENQNSAGQGCGAFVNAPNAGAGSVSAGAKPNVASAAYLPGMIRASYYTGFGAAVVKDGLATWYDDYATAMAALGDATAVKVFVKLANSTVATTTAAAIEFTEIANVADNKVGAGTKVNKDITSDLATYAVAGTAVKDLGAGVYMIATPVTPEITLTPEIAEYTAELAFPTVTVTGSYVKDTDYTVAWDPATITEPADAATTNAYTVTVTMIGTYTGSATATFKVYKKAAIAVTGVTLSETTTNLTVGASCTLTATVAPEDAADKSVTWSTSDGEVATVADGVVTAVKAGTATITVTTTDGGKTATCTVTVSAASGPTIEPGETSTTSTATTPEAATNEVVMVSPDENVVSNENYKKYFTFTVTGGSGNYTVTAKLNEDAIALDETVEDVATTGIAEVLKAEAGEEATASVEAKPGLWYSASVVTGLEGANWAAGEGARTQATGDTVDLKITRPSSGNTCFIKVMVNTTNK